MKTEEEIRIDKFLWAVRLYKTRTIASDSCKNGKIISSGIAVKPSRTVKAGEIFDIKQNIITRSYRIKKILSKRVGAKLVADYLEEITLQTELDKLEVQNNISIKKREKGTGRPTKKERRDINRFFG